MRQLIRCNFVRMSDLTIKQKKEYSELLYTRHGMTQKEIAAKVGVSEKSISKWKEKYDWDTLKASYSVTKQQQLKDVYAQINALNEMIRRRDPDERFATPSEADTLSKLAATAKSLETETSIHELVNSFQAFIEWLRPLDLAKAQEFIDLQDQFIKSRL